ncbi:hypothetical protein FB45DRAFT_1020076 [Roridomyces roridus]|uniref:F-box domain-containing protein n=1 Tax=Roridomyces roridus TaxID=1738132 RepID=A0AAD7CG80_9AGAR|nr:hypothetical protein FB45DRAFT_1020076 [Roridomyces roridus]
MHRCFEIPELVDEIVSHIPLLLDQDKPFLAVLARTARLFHNSALNHLWQYQRSLRPLLLCMPPDLVQEEVVDGKHSLVSNSLPLQTGLLRRLQKFLRPVQSSDWERPRRYARRVRIFSSNSSSFSSDDFPYSAICPLLDVVDDCIFPNLIKLFWEHSDENFPHIGLFLSPNITVLAIKCDASSSLAILSMLPRKCPSVTRVDMIHPRDHSVTEATRNLVSTFIPQLCCIQDLHMHIYDMALLQHIARLPCLQTLCVLSLPTALPASRRAEKPLFPSLRLLRCENPNPLSMSRLFELCSDNTLNAFRMTISHATNVPEVIRQLLAALVNSQRSSLTELYIRVEPVWDPFQIESDGIYTIECLQPALGFSNLTHVRITSNPGFDLDDLAICEMARAWS